MLDSAFGSTTPSVVVGRTLSSYTVSGIQNHQETITYTVYNEQATAETGVLLTTTLEPGVTYASASILPDQSGQNLAWSLGTIAGYDRASVSLTVTLANSTPLQLDSGARAYAILNADSVTNSTPAATLSTITVPTGTLDSTPDANTTDPYIQEEAAKLSYDPNQIFNFLHTQVGYNSYTGSVRGARGTLWSNAGNALDVASLGVALMRASGIPAQYVSGTLSQTQAQGLILSMFPASYQTVGYIPAGTTVSHPATDPQLISETENHYWFQFNTGTGFVNADPLMFGATLGQTFTTSTGTFTEVAQDLRATTEVQLVAEIDNTASSLFGLSGLQDTTVIDQTFIDVDLVGRPLTVGNLVTSNTVGAFALSSTTNTYQPYIAMGDFASGNRGADQVYKGTTYQEFVTNFPFGSELLTGLFLNVTSSAPSATGQVVTDTVNKTLFDRLGFAARQGDASTTPVVSPSAGPSVTNQDITTLDVSPVSNIPYAVQDSQVLADSNLETSLNALIPAGSSSVSTKNAAALAQASTLAADGLVQANLAVASTFDWESDLLFNSFVANTHALAYPGSPRIIAITNSSTTDQTTGNTTDSLNLDIIRDQVRSYAAPGQNSVVSTDNQAIRGLIDSTVEVQVLGDLGSAPSSATASGSLPILIQAAQTPGISILPIDSSDLSMLNGLNLSAEAKARITQDALQGNLDLVPSQMIMVQGSETIAWLNDNVTTGTLIAVSENGTHDAFVDDAAVETAQAETDGFIQAGIQKGTQLLKQAVQLENKGKFKEAKKLLQTLTQIDPLLFEESAALIGAYKIAATTKVFVDNANVLSTLQYYESKDPSIGDVLFAASQLGQTPDNPSVPGDQASGPVAIVAPSLTSGTTQAVATAGALAVDGTISASWSSSAVGSFSVTALTASSGTVLDSSGKTIGTGAIAFSPLNSSSVSISGSNTFQVNGTGSLSFYGPSESSLGVSGNWTSYQASIGGNVSVTIGASGLSLNGQILPSGIYKIETSSASLTGSGPTSSPNFSGSASLSVTGSTINLDARMGSVSVGTQSISLTSGATLTSFAGTIGVTVDGNGLDHVVLAGSSGGVLSVSASSSTLTTDQNTPVNFSTMIHTSLADSYTVTALAPAGWTLSINAQGQVTVTPAPGTQAGTYPIDVTVQSSTDPQLVTQSIVEVTITPTTPGLALGVAPDPLFVVPFNGLGIPSSFLASLQNLGPASDTYNLTITNVPSGFSVLESTTSLTVPAGQTGILGLYLQPDAGQSLPVPGTVLTFTVTAVSTTTQAITKSQVVTFTVPAIDAVTLSSSPSSLSVTPGVSVADTITITNVGNVAESNIALTDSLSSGLNLTGLTPVTLDVGQSTTETVMVTPSASTPLNSILQATLTATYGASASTQTLTLPVDVVVPGAVAIGNASNAASQLGNSDLASRLSDLSTAITNLVQNPSSLVYRSQSVADVNAITVLLGNDPFLAPLSANLTTDGVALSIASTANSVQSALTALSSDLTTLNTNLNDEIQNNFTLALVTNSQTAQPQTPVTFVILLQNTGQAYSIYDLSISGLPTGVTATFSSVRIGLAPGQSTTDPGAQSATVTLTSTSSTSLPAFNFQVTATAEGAPEIIRTTTGSLTARAEVVSVVSVATNPPFTDPGGTVDVTARILNAVNQTESAEVSFIIANSLGTTLYTSQPTTISLAVLTTLLTVDLGSFSTTGFVNGIDTIKVVVTDINGNILPGNDATGSLQIGSPVTATQSVSPDNLPIGSGTVTNSVTVALDPNATAPLNLVGQLAPNGGASSVAIDGNYAYVGSSSGINIINVSDPTNPVVVGNFGLSDFPANSSIFAKVSGNELVVETSQNNVNTTLLIYSLADPLHPTLLGQTPVTNDYLINGFVLSDNHAYFYSHWVEYYTASGTIFQQHGEVISVDISNPAAPVPTGIVYNQPPDSGSGFPDGDSNIFSNLPVNSSTLFAASTTATMGTLTGTGEVLVIDTSNPSAPALATTLMVPGTTFIVAMALESGNRALLIGSTGGYTSNSTDPIFGPSGNLVLITLDISDPRNPLILSTQPLDRSSRGSYNINLVPIGGNKYVFSSVGSSTDQPAFFFIDASGSGNAVVTSLTTPTYSIAYDVSGNYLYATSSSGLLIYNIGQATTETPITMDVQIPNNTGVSIVPGSFNVTPTSITTGTNFDTIEWNLSLDPANPTQTFTYQTAVTGLQAGVSLPVTNGTTVSFNSQGTPSSFVLAPLTVAGQQFLGIVPSSITTAPGQAVSYDVRLENPTPSSVTYNLALNGVPSSWSNLPATEVVAAGGENDFYFNLTPAATTSPATFGFSITATTIGGVSGSASSRLIVQGQPVVLDSQSHGIVATLTPIEATAGRGTSAQYVVQLTNTGSTTDTYTLQFQSTDLSGNVNAVFGQTTIEVPPGVSNYRDIPLTLSPLGGASPISGRFTVIAQLTSNSAISSTVGGTLDIVASGVTASLNTSSIAPGGTLELTVTNTGSVTDTFDLSLGGPAALVATLGSTKVKLAPGLSTVVPISTSAVNFAVQGGLGLTAIATSETNSAVKSDAAASLAIPATTGMTAQLTPATQLLPIPGTTSFLLIVHNTGNTEDSYSATLMGTSGPIQANLVGLDGSPTSSIPIFRLPGLSTGEIVLQANLEGIGQGTVRVQIQSLTNPSSTATETATVTSTPTTTLQLTSSSTQATIGQPVTFTAVVSTASSSVTPSGSVIFTIDGVPQAPVALSLIGGKDEANFVTSSLGAGTHQVSAAFSGTNFGPSSTGPVSIEVSQGTVNPVNPVVASSLLLSGPSVPVAFGQAVTIIATLTTSSSKSTPTGSIVFDVDGSEQLSVPIQVINGVAQAVLTLNGLSAGLHAVLATYAGDAVVAASLSPVLLATVNSPIIVPPPVIDGPQVVQVQRYGYHSLPNSFVITFNEALDPSRAQNVANYRIIGPGGVVEPIKSAIYDPAKMTVTLFPRKSLDLHAIYRLTITGIGAGGVADVSGNRLDGARTGLPGSNYTGLLEASQLVLGVSVPGGPAQTAKLRLELAQIVSNQARELASQEAAGKKAIRKKELAKQESVVKKAIRNGTQITSRLARNMVSSSWIGGKPRRNSTWKPMHRESNG